jgi:two-component system CheB/CheR fusion protein
MVTFATQNAFDYSPAQNLDLISCRNLMIYLGSALQTKLLLLFHAALKHDGVLILSPSESVGKQASLFAPFHRKLKIYLANGFPPTSAPR